MKIINSIDNLSEIDSTGEFVDLERFLIVEELQIIWIEQVATNPLHFVTSSHLSQYHLLSSNK